MGLNPQKGNMYPWVTDTWNPIRGKCVHACSYCFAVRHHTKPLRLVDKEFEIKLGEGKTIFLGSATDMFASSVPGEWIRAVLARCRLFPGNTYLFQTKNAKRLYSFQREFPKYVILGTTIETNRDYRDYGASRGPKPMDRVTAMGLLSGAGFRTMVSIEPIMDFDLEELQKAIELTHPGWVSIGADSQGHHLPEPPGFMVEALIAALKRTTEVEIKDNLSRLLREMPK